MYKDLTGHDYEEKSSDELNQETKELMDMLARGKL